MTEARTLLLPSSVLGPMLNQALHSVLVSGRDYAHGFGSNRFRRQDREFIEHGPSVVTYVNDYLQVQGCDARATLTEPWRFSDPGQRPTCHLSVSYRGGRRRLITVSTHRPGVREIPELSGAQLAEARRKYEESARFEERSTRANESLAKLADCLKSIVEEAYRNAEHRLSDSAREDFRATGLMGSGVATWLKAGIILGLDPDDLLVDAGLMMARIYQITRP